jgi:hypothetical protein
MMALSFSLSITRPKAELASLSEPLEQRLAVMPSWVEQQLADLVGLLSTHPNARRLNCNGSGCASR